MGIKSGILKLFADRTHRQIKEWSRTAVNDQLNIMVQLLRKGRFTAIGRDLYFSSIRHYDDFKQHVPIGDYEYQKHYFDRIIAGESDVLWPGRPKYFAKTSGTTSGVKYIPLTTDCLPNHINSARNAIFSYIGQTGNYKVFDGKLIFLSGSPELKKTRDVYTGRLSGIVNHEIPVWAKSNQVPSYTTNCIDDWEEKLERIIDETMHVDMRLISGIPPWVVMYYERLLLRTGKKNIKDIFPNFTLFIHGGVNFEPYRSVLEELTGKPIDTIETYPASEGFIAFQDDFTQEGLILNSRSGIFFEFIPYADVFKEYPTRLHLGQVEKGVDYALVINNNAGLWGYLIGDLVRFVSLDPYRIIVTGRIKHFISAFGEHVIASEVEQALLSVAGQEGCGIIEFTVAPNIHPVDAALPYHEWFIEFDKLPANLNDFALKVDAVMQQKNIYYKDLIQGKILQPLVIRPLKKDSFRNFMKKSGKLGGQNKVPRLSNDRTIAVDLEMYVLT